MKHILMKQLKSKNPNPENVKAYGFEWNCVWSNCTGCSATCGSVCRESCTSECGITCSASCNYAFDIH